MARPGFKFLPNMVMSKLCMAEPIAILVFYTSELFNSISLGQDRDEA